MLERWTERASDLETEEKLLIFNTSGDSISSHKQMRCTERALELDLETEEKIELIFNQQIAGEVQKCIVSTFSSFPIHHRLKSIDWLQIKIKSNQLKSIDWLQLEKLIDLASDPRRRCQFWEKGFKSNFNENQFGKSQLPVAPFAALPDHGCVIDTKGPGSLKGLGSNYGRSVCFWCFQVSNRLKSGP